MGLTTEINTAVIVGVGELFLAAAQQHAALPASRGGSGGRSMTMGRRRSKVREWKGQCHERQPGVGADVSTNWAAERQGGEWQTQWQEWRPRNGSARQ